MKIDPKNVFSLRKGLNHIWRERSFKGGFDKHKKKVANVFSFYL